MLDLVAAIIGNYVIVAAAMVLFVTPFYALYRRGLVPEAQLQVGFNRRLEDFFSSRYANYLVLGWAYLEALVWFVIPEFLLLLVIVMRVRRKRSLLYFDIIGTVAGTITAFIVHLPPERIHQLPYITTGMVAQTERWYEHFGIWGLIYQPFSGVPFKVFTHLAPHYHFFILSFVVLAVIVRLSRYTVVYFALAWIAPAIHPYVYRRYVRLVVIATFIFSVLLLRTVAIYAPGYQVH